MHYKAAPWSQSMVSLHNTQELWYKSTHSTRHKAHEVKVISLCYENCDFSRDQLWLLCLCECCDCRGGQGHFETCLSDEERNNGPEALNRLPKYQYLPRQKEAHTCQGRSTWPCHTSSAISQRKSFQLFTTRTSSRISNSMICLNRTTLQLAQHTFKVIQSIQYYIVCTDRPHQIHGENHAVHGNSKFEVPTRY